MPEEITVFMCKTAWDYEVGSALGGNRIYPDEQDCRENCKCAEGCGIVEVKMSFVRTVQEPGDEDLA